MQQLSVAVVILNWNGKKLLEQFLPSVIATTYTHTHIIVADNASTDDSLIFIEQNYPSITVIKNKQNEGFAGGYNKALAYVKEDIIVLLNSDVAVTPNWIEPIIALLQQDENVAVVQPKILNYYNKLAFDYAGAAGGFIDKWGYPFAKGRVFNTIENDTLQYESNDEIFWASGATLFIRNSVYQQLGGLDELFFAHQEEIDLCWRVQLLGYKVKVCTASVVYHIGGATLEQGSLQKTYLNFRNNLLMLYKNLPLASKIAIIFFRFWLDALAAYHFLFKGQWKAFFAVAKAHIHFFWLIVRGKVNTHSLSKKPLSKLKGTTPKSIVYNYYAKGKKTFIEILPQKL